MKLSTFLVRYNRKVLVMVAAGAALVQLNFNGCNPQLRDTLLSGVETSLIGLVSTFIQAFFTSLSSQQTTSQPVVQAILHALPSFA